MSKSIKILIGIVALAIVAYGGYMLLRSGQASDSGVATAGETTLSREESLINKQFLQLLRSLKGIDLKEGDIFQNPAFANLNDISVELKPETVGRENPFAPLGDKGAISQTAKTDVPREESSRGRAPSAPNAENTNKVPARETSF